MPNKSKRKGNNFEYECVDALEHLFDKLDPEVERAFMSDGRSIGESTDCDIRVILKAVKDFKLIVQCKRRRDLPKWFLQKNSDILITRRDHGKRYYCFTEDGMKKLLEHLIWLYSTNISVD